MSYLCLELPTVKPLLIKCRLTVAPPSTALFLGVPSFLGHGIELWNRIIELNHSITRKAAKLFGYLLWKVRVREPHVHFHVHILYTMAGHLVILVGRHQLHQWLEARIVTMEQKLFRTEKVGIN
jgi:hypothetical protein